MKGIRFKIPNKWGFLIDDILRNISVDNYIWRIQEAEIYDNGLNDLFDEDCIAGKLFQKKISTNPYYAIFGKLQAFLFDSCNALDEIVTYADFQRSNCQLIILICDNIFVEIYGKDSVVLEQIHDNAMQYFTEVEKVMEIDDHLILKAI